jgi:hypothetical protein
VSRRVHPCRLAATGLARERRPLLGGAGSVGELGRLWGRWGVGRLPLEADVAATRDALDAQAALATNATAYHASGRASNATRLPACLEDPAATIAQHRTASHRTA